MAMALVPPETLSPSKISSFKDCALAFRFSAIDHLPEEPSPAAVRGTLVHLALEHLFEHNAADRTPDAARAALQQAVAEIQADPEFIELALDATAEQAFFDEAAALVEAYLEMEDPSTVHPIGLELMLETRLDGLRLRGIIDRLELDDDGGLVVTDYKTGRSPGPAYQQGRLGGVAFYALLCEELFGVLPSRVQLLYLGDRTVLATVPTQQATRSLRRKVAALWQAVETACEREDFRPRPGPLCNWCSFQAYCPAQGGDISLVEAARSTSAGQLAC